MPLNDQSQSTTANPETETMSLLTAVPWAWIRQVRHLVDTHATNIKPAPAQIFPWLYLANERFVRQPSLLSAHGITHVLTVNEMDVVSYMSLQQTLRQAGIQNHAYYPGLDHDDYDMIGLHWQDCQRFLQSVRDDAHDANGNNSKVVVHCQAGMNRSGVIVAAAYMILEQQPLLETVKHVIKQRGAVLWNRSFQKQLCLLAAKEGLLGDYPEGQSNEPMVEQPLPPPTTNLNW